jgi:hypothetical protein
MLTMVRQQFRGYCPSNQKKMAKVYELGAIFLLHEELIQLIKENTRHNGSLNVSKLVEAVEEFAYMRDWDGRMRNNLVGLVPYSDQVKK